MAAIRRDAVQDVHASQSSSCWIELTGRSRIIRRTNHATGRRPSYVGVGLKFSVTTQLSISLAPEIFCPLVTGEDVFEDLTDFRHVSMTRCAKAVVIKLRQEIVSMESTLVIFKRHQNLGTCALGYTDLTRSVWSC